MDYHFDSKADIKLIILSVLKTFNTPIPNSLVVDTVLTHSFAEYIDIMQYLHDLTEAQMVTYYIEKGVRYYSATPKGLEAVEYFSSQIPFSVRERLFETAKEKAKDFLNEEAVQADYSKLNDFEYNVTMRIVERGSDMFNLHIVVGSEDIAKKMCARFRKDPQGFYSEVFSRLIDFNVEN